MKRKTYNNVLLENLHNGMSVEWLIDKIQEKIITVAERIEIGKRNHEIIRICLKDFKSREIIGSYKVKMKFQKRF